MQLSHTAPRRRPVARWEHPEHGYTTVMTALLLVPMMIFAGFAVDVGSWYTRAMEIQRAADAAALAGVVWLPGDPGRAETEARLTAKRNGFDPSTNSNITISVQPVAGRPQELDVIVTDNAVPTFFGAVVTDDISISRSARARYVLPVPLGSPFNYFGNQNISPSASDPKLWAAINAPYARHQSGDPFAVRCAAEPTGVRSCDGSGNSRDYRPDGYRYIIEVPPSAVGQTLAVEVLDAPFAPRSSTTNETGDGFDFACCTGNTSTSTYTNRMAVSYELHEADPTPLDITDNPTMAGRCSTGPGNLVYGNNHGTPNSRTDDTSGRTNAARNAWTTICQVTVAVAGQYVLQVKTSGVRSGATVHANQGSGTNQYSLRATLSGSTQPRIYAYGDMSILTNYVISGGGSRANNYLAEVTPDNAGKSLAISLFDAGDGSNGQFDLSILMPDGSIPQCRYNEPGSTSLGSLRACTIRTRNNGEGNDKNRYNDQWLRIEIPLPTTYNCTKTGPTPANAGPGTSSACWWRLSYLFGGTNPTPTDRTTWQANVLGDPVQLIR